MVIVLCMPPTRYEPTLDRDPDYVSDCTLTPTHTSDKDIMYSTWSFDNKSTNPTKKKTTSESAQQERDRRVNAIELVNTIRDELTRVMPPLSASETLSTAFRQRGVPCIDSFTYQLLEKFRMGMGYTTKPWGHERKFMPLHRWETRDVVGTLWTIEPVISSVLVKGNGTDCASALATYESELQCIEPMSMMSAMTSPKADNQMRGRWAGWVLWRAEREQGWSDSACLNANLCSTLFAFSIHVRGMNLVHLAMTPEAVTMIATYARNVAVKMDITVSMLTLVTTKLVIQPAVKSKRGSSVKLYGNGSMQICGSPNDVEHLVSSTFSIVKMVLESDPYRFLSSMRQMRSMGV